MKYDPDPTNPRYLRFTCPACGRQYRSEGLLRAKTHYRSHRTRCPMLVGVGDTTCTR